MQEDNPVPCRLMLLLGLLGVAAVSTSVLYGSPLLFAGSTALILALLPDSRVPVWAKVAAPAALFPAAVILGKFPVPESFAFALLSALAALIVRRNRPSMFQEIPLHERLALLLLEVFKEPGNLQETEKLCKNLVDMIFEKLGYPNIYIVVRDGSPDRSGMMSFRLAAYRGLSQSQYVSVLKENNLKGIWGRVVETRAPYLCRFCEADPFYIMGNPSTRSELTVPLVLKDTVWGLIDLQSDEDDAFSDEDVKVLSFIATNLAILFENAGVVAALEQRGKRMTLLHDVVQSLALSRSIKDLCARVVQSLAETLGFSAVSIYRVEDGSIPQVVASSAYPESFHGEVNAKMRSNTGLVGKSMREGRIRNTEDVHLEDSWLPVVPSVRSQLDVPIDHDGTLLGVLVFEADTVGAFSRMDEEVFSILARHIAVAWNMHLILDSLRDQALRDPMTGLWNTRYLKNRISEEIARTRRGGRPFTVVMIDVGNFKMINDIYGHLEGDAVIRCIGEKLLSGVRQYDAVIRFGGDEFVLVLPGISRVEAENLVRRMDLSEIRTDSGIRETVRLDWGAAVFGEDGTTVEEILKSADAAMYRKKEENRGMAGK